MISLKRFLDSDKGEADPSAQRACSLLMEAIALHAVQNNPVAYGIFRDDIRGLRRQCEDPATPDQVFAATGQVIQLMETYNRKAEGFARVQTHEFQQMVGMLSRTLMDVTRENSRAGDHLSKIETDLDEAVDLDDLRLIKNKMQEALHSISEEAARQRDTAKKAADELYEHLNSERTGGDAVDTVTGLPDASQAERAIEKAIADPAPGFVAVLCLERLDGINSRFGYGMGDRLMSRFAQDVSQRLGPSDTMFRWRGPTLVVILGRAQLARNVRIEVGNLAGQRREQHEQFQGRTVLLPISVRWTAVSLKEVTSLGEVLERMSMFVASATNQMLEA